MASSVRRWWLVVVLAVSAAVIALFAFRAGTRSTANPVMGPSAATCRSAELAWLQAARAQLNTFANGGTPSADEEEAAWAPVAKNCGPNNRLVSSTIPPVKLQLAGLYLGVDAGEVRNISGLIDDAQAAIEGGEPDGTVGTTQAPSAASGSARQTASGSTRDSTTETTQAPRVNGTSVVYPGDGVEVWRYPGELSKLSATSAKFRAFVAGQLNEMYDGAYPLPPACAHAPAVTIKEYRPTVAYGGEGVEPGGPAQAPSQCARGGAAVFFIFRGGRWSSPAALQAQDYLQCGVLRKWRIPQMTGATRCYAGSKEVAYRP